MPLRHDHVRVRVPATSANLGPGFDSLGLALALYDEIDVRAVAGRSVVEVVGCGAGEVPDDENHLVVKAIHAGLDWLGAPLTGVHLRCHNKIPHGRGLGSSAAAVVAGLAAASCLVDAEGAIGAEDMLNLAQQFEGHPDNAAPAILGGLTIAWTHEAGVSAGAHGATVAADAVKVAMSDSVTPIALIPSGTLATAAARIALPSKVPMPDAAANVARAALLIEALTRRPESELLLEATRDALHQDYREAAMPESLALVRRLRELGLAAVVSGAGPSVLVLCGTSTAGSLIETVRRNPAALEEFAPQWQVIAPGVARDGVRAVVL